MKNLGFKNLLLIATLTLVALSVAVSGIISYQNEAKTLTNLIITNTLFQHKKAHRTTWEAPYRKFTTRTGEQRRNPVRNQIDYIITKISHRRFVTDARSYGGIRTDTNHKLVKARFHVK